MSLARKLCAGTFGFFAGILTTPFAFAYGFWGVGKNHSPNSYATRVALGAVGFVFGLILTFATAVGFLFGIYAARKGYNEGFEAGGKATFRAWDNVLANQPNSQSSPKQAHAPKPVPHFANSHVTACSKLGIPPVVHQTAIVPIGRETPLPPRKNYKYNRAAAEYNGIHDPIRHPSRR